MALINFSQEEINNLNNSIKEIDISASVIDGLVSEITNKYSKDLDAYVIFIKDCLADGNHPATDEELEDFCINLSTLIYFAGSMCENLGVRDDISRAVYREQYNLNRNMTNGTIADKDGWAELNTQLEQTTNVVYNRAWKTMKSKVENAQELLSSCKKVLSRRMQELQLTNIQVTG